MNEKSKTINVSDDKRYHLFSLLFYLLPMLFLGLSIITTFSIFHSVREEMAEKQLGIVRQTKNTLDYCIVQHEEIAHGIMLSVFYQITNSTPENEQYEEYVEVSHLLSAYADRGMISAMRLYVPDEKVYSNQKDVFYPLSDLLSGSYGQHTSAGFHWLPTHSVRISFGKEESSIGLLYNVSKLDDYTSLASALMLYIPVESINSIFATAEEELFLVDKSGVAIAHRNESFIGQTLLSEAEMEMMNSRRAGTDISGGRLISFSHLDKSGWILVGRSPGHSTIMLDSPQLLLLGALWTITILTLAFLLLKLVYNRFISSTIGVISDMARSFIPADDIQERPMTLRRHRLPSLQTKWKLEKAMQTMAQSIEKHYQDQIDLANYQMQALQAQIKPHFLYNTLDVIKWMILEGRYQDGIWMVNSLSKYLRMSINKVSAFVTLRQELELGHIYLDMMQKRFDNRFSVVFDIEENAIDCLLPRLLLQPIMENALIHGLLYCEKSNAALQIRAWCEKNVLFVEIEDNGSGMSKEKLEAFTHPVPGQGGYGLRNIRKRLELFGGTGAEIRIHSKENVGTCVSITLPVKRHD